MAGRGNCRGNGGGVAAGAVAAAAVGSALAAGAAGNLAASRAEQAAQEVQEDCLRSQTQELGEDMPMCRHVNPIATTIGCCSVEKQLWELNQVLDYQNKILVELLQAVRERNG